MRAFKLTLIVFVLGFGFGDTAHADELAVPPIGGTCVPDSATIRAGHCETAGFGVRFMPAARSSPCGRPAGMEVMACRSTGTAGT